MFEEELNKYFWKSFQSTNLKYKNKIIEKWLKKIPKWLLTETRFSVMNKFIWKREKTYKKFLEEEKFRKKYKHFYWKQPNKVKKIFLNIWFEKIEKFSKKFQIKEKLYFLRFELENNLKIKVKNGKPICDLCENEIIFDDCVRNRLWRYFKNIEEVCTQCNPKKKWFSIKERKFVEYLKTIYNGKIILNHKYWDFTREFDIYLPDKNVAIEYNWTFWHRNEKINHKYNYCTKNNINFIIIWEHNEDDWKEALNNFLNNKKFTEKTLILENMYHNLTPKGYTKIQEIKQIYKKVWKYRIYNLWQTKYERD